MECLEGEPVFSNHGSFTQVKGAKCKLPSEVVCSLNNESSSAFAGSTSRGLQGGEASSALNPDPEAAYAVWQGSALDNSGF